MGELWEPRVVRCDCTLEWCRRRRTSADARDMVRHFALPLKSVERQIVLKVLRPGAKAIGENSSLQFLWWHLRASAFVWKDEFDRRSKNKTPRWTLRTNVPLAASNTYEEPPPDGKNAAFDGEKWVVLGPAESHALRLVNRTKKRGRSSDDEQGTVSSTICARRQFKASHIENAWTLLHQAATSPDACKAVDLLKSYVNFLCEELQAARTVPAYLETKSSRLGERADEQRQEQNQHLWQHREEQGLQTNSHQQQEKQPEEQLAEQRRQLIRETQQQQQREEHHLKQQQENRRQHYPQLQQQQQQGREQLQRVQGQGHGLLEPGSPDHQSEHLHLNSLLVSTFNNSHALLEQMQHHLPPHVDRYHGP